MIPSKHASMPFSSLLFRALLPLVPLCVLSLSYLYLYPVFHGCAFPAPVASSYNASSASTWFLGPGGQQQHAAHAVASIPTVAPFRLLTLGDPQLEGDSSLPGLNKDGKGLLPSLFPFRIYSPWSLNLRTVRTALRDLVKKDVPRLLEYARKWLDLWGNDFYLAHIYRTVHWWSAPTHVVVLGDLLGSQWVDDAEFDRRSDRFWDRVFKGGQRVADDITSMLEEGEIQSELGAERMETLGADEAWNRRIIAVAGNHDIGYAGDIDEKRISRFEKRFGRVNWTLRLALPAEDNKEGLQDAPIATNNYSAARSPPPNLRLVVLNSMNLDTPALKKELQQETYEFLNTAILSQPPLPDTPTYDNTASILLTHIPLHKRSGVCADAPFFDFFSNHEGDGVKEQNHLSDYVSQHGILEGIFGMSGNLDSPNKGMGRTGVILTGHDHVGCDVWHHWNRTRYEEEQSRDPSLAEGEEPEEKPTENFWDAEPYAEARDLLDLHERTLRGNEGALAYPGVREITVRSMMGEFGGNAGLLSAWFDEDLQEWRFEYASCSLGVQHIWWAVHIFAVAVLATAVLAFIARSVEQRSTTENTQKASPKPASATTPPINRVRTPAEIMKQRRERQRLLEEQRGYHRSVPNKAAKHESEGGEKKQMMK